MFRAKIEASKLFSIVQGFRPAIWNKDNIKVQSLGWKKEGRKTKKIRIKVRRNQEKLNEEITANQICPSSQTGHQRKWSTTKSVEESTRAENQIVPERRKKEEKAILRVDDKNLHKGMESTSSH